MKQHFNKRVYDFKVGSTTGPYADKFPQDPTFIGFHLLFEFPQVAHFASIGVPVSNTRLASVGINYVQSGLLCKEDHPEGAHTYLGRIGERGRQYYVRQFNKLLLEISTKYPWYFKSITGIDNLWKVNKESGMRVPLDRSGINLTIECLEDIGLRTTMLADLYRKASYDPVGGKWVLPIDKRRFNMVIIVSDYALRYGVPNDELRALMKTKVDEDQVQRYDPINNPKAITTTTGNQEEVKQGTGSVVKDNGTTNDSPSSPSNSTNTASGKSIKDQEKDKQKNLQNSTSGAKGDIITENPLEQFSPSSAFNNLTNTLSNLVGQGSTDPTVSNLVTDITQQLGLGAIKDQILGTADSLFNQYKDFANNLPGLSDIQALGLGNQDKNHLQIYNDDDSILSYLVFELIDCEFDFDELTYIGHIDQNPTMAEFKFSIKVGQVYEYNQYNLRQMAVIDAVGRFTEGDGNQVSPIDLFRKVKKNYDSFVYPLNPLTPGGAEGKPFKIANFGEAVWQRALNNSNFGKQLKDAGEKFAQKIKLKASELGLNKATEWTPNAVLGKTLDFITGTPDLANPQYGLTRGDLTNAGLKRPIVSNESLGNAKLDKPKVFDGVSKQSLIPPKVEKLISNTNENLQSPKVILGISDIDLLLPAVKKGIQKNTLIAPKVATDIKDEKLIVPSVNDTISDISLIKPQVKNDIEDVNLVKPSVNTSINNETLIVPKVANNISDVSLIRPGVNTDISDESLIAPNVNTKIQDELLIEPLVNTEISQSQLLSPDVSNSISDVSLIPPGVNTDISDESLIAPSINTKFDNEVLIAPDVANEIVDQVLISPDVLVAIDDQVLISPDINTSITDQVLILPSVNSDINSSVLIAPDVAKTITNQDLIAPDVNDKISTTPLISPEVAKEIKDQELIAPDVAKEIKDQELIAPDVAKGITDEKLIPPVINSDVGKLKLVSNPVEDRIKEKADLIAPAVLNEISSKDLLAPNVISEKLKNADLSTFEKKVLNNEKAKLIPADVHNKLEDKMKLESPNIKVEKLRNLDLNEAKVISTELKNLHIPITEINKEKVLGKVNLSTTILDDKLKNLKLVEPLVNKEDGLTVKLIEPNQAKNSIGNLKLESPELKNVILENNDLIKPDIKVEGVFKQVLISPEVIGDLSDVVLLKPEVKGSNLEKEILNKPIIDVSLISKQDLIEPKVNFDIHDVELLSPVVEVDKLRGLDLVEPVINKGLKDQQLIEPKVNQDIVNIDKLISPDVKETIKENKLEQISPEVKTRLSENAHLFETPFSDIIKDSKQNLEAPLVKSGELDKIEFKEDTKNLGGHLGNADLSTGVINNLLEGKIELQAPPVKTKFVGGTRETLVGSIKSTHLNNEKANLVVPGSGDNSLEDVHLIEPGVKSTIDEINIYGKGTRTERVRPYNLDEIYPDGLGGKPIID